LAQHYHPDDVSTIVSCSQDHFDFSEHCKVVKPLPLSYTEIPPVGPLQKDTLTPKLDQSLVSESPSYALEMSSEHAWLERLCDLLDCGNCSDIASSDTINSVDCSWSSYHASAQSSVPQNQISTSVLLPLFRDQAHSPAMMCHAMTIVMNTVHSVNPGQIPVLTLDQPLYAIAKLAVAMA